MHGRGGTNTLGACALGEVGLALDGLECLQRDESRESRATRRGRRSRQPPQIKGSSCVASQLPTALSSSSYSFNILDNLSRVHIG